MCNENKICLSEIKSCSLNFLNKMKDSCRQSSKTLFKKFVKFIHTCVVDYAREIRVVGVIRSETKIEFA